MDELIRLTNSAGKAFVDFAWPMLIQSGVLVLLLLLADLMLRKKVRAVFRYWIWMLVLIKLILPTSLSSPVSFGYWFGDKIGFTRVNQTIQNPQPDRLPAGGSVKHGLPPIQSGVAIPKVSDFEAATRQSAEPIPTEIISPPTVSAALLSWQGALFLTWLAVGQ